MVKEAVWSGIVEEREQDILDFLAGKTMAIVPGSREQTKAGVCLLARKTIAIVLASREQNKAAVRLVPHQRLCCHTSALLSFSDEIHQLWPAKWSTWFT